MKSRKITKKKAKSSSKKMTKKSIPVSKKKSAPHGNASEQVAAAAGNRLSKVAGLTALEFLEKTWPDAPSKEVLAAFEHLKSSLNGKKTEGVIQYKTDSVDVERGQPQPWPPEGTGISNFNPLDLMRRILMTQDMLFLSRQITYHISAAPDLPGIWGDMDRINQAFSKLIEHTVKHADRGTRIDISISSFALRNGAGVKISFESHDRSLDDVDSQEFLDSLLHGKQDEGSGVSLYACRQTILHQRGQMWADLPKPHHPVYHILLPATEDVARQPYSEQQTFKYDISITNYANVRKRFGIKKSASLVTQIEHYIRGLVRYPIDMVISIGDKGTITTIYETQKGSANSVASRISQRLGREEFRIGKRPVELMFRYNLSQLTPPHTEDQESKGQRSH